MAANTEGVKASDVNGSAKAPFQPELVSAKEPPVGLHVQHVEDEDMVLVREAAQEMNHHFDFQVPEGKKIIEIGLSFSACEGGCGLQVPVVDVGHRYACNPHKLAKLEDGSPEGPRTRMLVCTPDKFPKLEALLRHIHSEVFAHAEGTRDYDRRGLNIIVRRYQEGDRLVFHSDRPWLAEEIYGVVLQQHGDPGDPDSADSGAPGLEWRRPADKESWQWVDYDDWQWDYSKYEVYSPMETAGACYFMSGPSRNEWKHGSDRFEGLRLSVTWRWFNEATLSAGEKAMY